MNKDTFLRTLETKLIILNENEREDILTEYSDVIDQKIKDGKTETEAVEDFGDLKELVREIYDAYRISKDCDKLVSSHEQDQGKFNAANTVKEASSPTPSITNLKMEDEPSLATLHHQTNPNQAYEEVSGNGVTVEMSDESGVDESQKAASKESSLDEGHEETCSATNRNQLAKTICDELQSDEVCKERSNEFSVSDKLEEINDDSKSVEQEEENSNELKNLEQVDRHHQNVSDLQAITEHDQKDNDIDGLNKIEGNNNLSHREETKPTENEKKDVKNDIDPVKEESDMSLDVGVLNDATFTKKPFSETVKSGSRTVMNAVKRAGVATYIGINKGFNATCIHVKRGYNTSRRKVNQVLDEHNALKRLELSAIKAERDYAQIRALKQDELNYEHDSIEAQEEHDLKLTGTQDNIIEKVKNNQQLRKEKTAASKELQIKKQALRSTDQHNHIGIDDNGDYAMEIKQSNVKEGKQIAIERKQKHKTLISLQRSELRAKQKMENELRRGELRKIRQERKFKQKLNNESVDQQSRYYVLPIVLVGKLMFSFLYAGFYLLFSFLYVCQKLISFGVFLLVACLSATLSILLLGFMTAFLVLAFKFHYVYVYPALVCFGVFIMTVGSSSSIGSLFSAISKGNSSLFNRLFSRYHHLFKRVIFGVRD